MERHIRKARLDDIDTLVPLFQGYLAFYQRSADSTATRAYLQARLSAADATALLAELDGEVVGFALLYPSWSSLNLAAVWHLSDLYVDPGTRGYGAGRALLEACEALGRETGAIRLQLETQRTNTVAQALYTELGWEVDDEFCSYSLSLGADA